jgi:uncharacterized protein (DUF305 family)
VKQRLAHERAVQVAAIAVAAAVMAILAGCGSTPAPAASGPDSFSSAPAASAVSRSTPTPTPAGLPTVAVPAMSGPHNEIDSMFATDMIPHHRQAVEMAKLASTAASDPRIKALAERIERTQDAEIAFMAGWLKAWGDAVPAPDEMHSAHGPGMMTHAEMEDLKTVKGSTFDKMFADMMVRHHQGALQMAGVTKEQGQNPAVRALATNVVITQTAEVAELTEILDSL